MSKARKARRAAERAAPADGGWRPALPPAVLLALAVVVAGVLWASRGRRADPPSPAVPAGSTAATASPAAPPAEASPALQKLRGRWLRTDGGYVVEIRSVDASGKLDAAYFNPRPIHVAKAEASRAGEAVNLFIELRDTNYPGSTYTLTLSPDGSLMRGTYFQAVARETYEVVFARQ